MTKSLTNRVTPREVAATNTNVPSNGVSFDDFIYLCVKLQVYIYKCYILKQNTYTSFKLIIKQQLLLLVLS